MPHPDTPATSVSARALGQRLRAETADLHHATEAAVGIPGAVDSVANYVALLRSSLRFYASAQGGFDDDRWSTGWRDAGVTIEQHDRTGLLRDDLRKLGIEPNGDVAPAQTFDSFAEALGWLYVVEGSALGGRFIAPEIVKTLGAVPCRFYRGDGREHPTEWRSLQAALTWFERSGGDTDAVIEGAVDAFTVFGETVSVSGPARDSAGVDSGVGALAR